MEAYSARAWGNRRYPRVPQVEGPIASIREQRALVADARPSVNLKGAGTSRVARRLTTPPTEIASTPTLEKLHRPLVGRVRARLEREGIAAATAASGVDEANHQRPECSLNHGRRDDNHHRGPALQARADVRGGNLKEACEEDPEADHLATANADRIND